jgi:N-acetyl sugar amidotransferase
MTESIQDLGLKYCIRCCMPETHRNAHFDELGICRGCRSSEKKIHISWTEREAMLREILEKAKAESGNNYDCVLPLSGGKDSMFQAHVLINVYGMKPLGVTHNTNWYSKTGYYNLMNLLEVFEIDHMMFTPNRGLVNKLAKRSLSKIGDACWHCHSGAGAYPWQVATKFKIPLLVYGESTAESHGRTSYDKDEFTHDMNYFTNVSAGCNPSEMTGDGISGADVLPYQLPSQQEADEVGVTGIHLGDFVFWDHERQTEFVRDEYGWMETDIESSYKHYKSAECIMPGVHDFTCYLKRGYSRATAEGSFDVRNGMLSRSEAEELIAQVDPVRPKALDYYLQITDMTETEFHDVMSSQREPQLQGRELPMLENSREHREQLVPFPLQLIEEVRREHRPHYVLERKRVAPLGETPVSDEEIVDWSAREIVDQLLSSRVSATAVADAFYRRAEELNERYHIFVAMSREHMLEQAQSVEQSLNSGKPGRVLSGVPVGIKDIYNTEVLPTQMGSPIWKGFKAGNDARAVSHITRAGGVLAGKTVTAEFGVHALQDTLNPHDTSRNPGTSSSGSAVGVATGAFPVALASQTAGSITRPASYCGVYGMKPSFGLIPRTGTLKTNDTLDTLGFLVRHQEDLTTVFEALRVHGHNYPASDAALSDSDRQNKRKDAPWRVAFARTHTWEEASPYARDGLTEWMARLAGFPGIDVEEIELAEASDAHDVHGLIYDKSLAYYFQEEGLQAEQVSRTMNEIIGRGNEVTPEAYWAALGRQEGLITWADQLMGQYDVTVSLATAGSAPLREAEEPRDPSLMWTLMHLPTVSVPKFVAKDGLPFGIQIVARKYNDLKLLRFIDFLRELGEVPSGPNPLL